MSGSPTHTELALTVNAHDRDLANIRPRLATVERHAKNCADAAQVHRDAARQIEQLRSEFDSEQRAMLHSATRVLEEKAEVIDEIRETQRLDVHVKRELLKSKKERDRVVKRIAVWAGTIVTVGEVLRLAWPALVAAWSKVFA
jgi:hypothetical protein